MEHLAELTAEEMTAVDGGLFFTPLVPVLVVAAIVYVIAT